MSRDLGLLGELAHRRPGAIAQLGELNQDRLVDDVTADALRDLQQEDGDSSEAEKLIGVWRSVDGSSLPRGSGLQT